MNSRAVDALALVAIVAVTRIPFFAATFFEYDALNYAVALHNFDPGQDTPQLPGYLLHIGIAKLLDALVHDANRAFVLESFLLSLGSVLFVWWGIGARASRLTAFWGSVVWALNPIFWLYGCVATVYPHEAFFTSAVAALCLRYCADAERQRWRATYPLAIAATVAIAGAARQTSLLFLGPAAIVALWTVRPPRRMWLGATIVALGIVLAWAGILVQLSGGLARYLQLARLDSVVVSDSVLLHGTPERHAGMVAKMALFLAIGTAPLWTLALFAALRRFDALRQILGHGLRSPEGRVLLTLALVPLSFYTLIFWAKPGYLLGVYAVAMMVAAILVDRLARRGIAGVHAWGAAWSVLGIVYFAVPLPGKSVEAMHRQAAYAAGVEVTKRYPSLRDKIEAGMIRAFTFGSSAGIAAVDRENRAMLNALDRLSTPRERIAFLGNRWSQWAFFYHPETAVYDFMLRRNESRNPTINQHWTKHPLKGPVVNLPPEMTDEVILQLWSGHWALPDIQRQVHLEALPMPPNCDLYRITDRNFRLRLGNFVFVRQDASARHRHHEMGGHKTSGPP